MELQDAAWARFVQTGQVTDYLQYCSVRGAAAANSLNAPKKGKLNAPGHKRSRPAGTGRG
ncbi:MAG: hypothetical protein LBT21_05935 [Oscillospiraceae bacterium]|jgi:hypothetical protein|nr:hypothetical protein [Oscillospiraceae bacterium]